MRTHESGTPLRWTTAGAGFGIRSAWAGRVGLLASGAAALLGAWPALGIPPLIQLPGTSGCVSETGTGGACADSVALDGATAAVVSPDGRNVYVVSTGSHALVAFDRSHVTGALTPKLGASLCISETGTGGACADCTRCTAVAIEAHLQALLTP